MKAQTLWPQTFDQDPADAEPERIATGKHHTPLVGVESGQSLAEADRIVAVDAPC